MKLRGFIVQEISISVLGDNGFSIFGWRKKEKNGSARFSHVFDCSCEKGNINKNIEERILVQVENKRRKKRKRVILFFSLCICNK